MILHEKKETYFLRHFKVTHKGILKHITNPNWHNKQDCTTIT